MGVWSKNIDSPHLIQPCPVIVCFRMLRAVGDHAHRVYECFWDEDREARVYFRCGYASFADQSHLAIAIVPGSVVACPQYFPTRPKMVLSSYK